MNASRLAGAALALLAVSAAATAQEPAPRTFAIHSVRLFDGERVTPVTTVIVRDGRVAEIAQRRTPPRDMPVIDGAGKTLMPGMIDAHSHTFEAGALEQALAFGVVAQLDQFTTPGYVARARREQEAGTATGRADLHSAGIVVTAPRGHGTQYGTPIPTLSSPDSADAFVAARLAEGSEWIKLIVEDGSAYGIRLPTLDLATLTAAVRAAHARRKLAVVHVATVAGARMAVAAGADGLVHLWIDSLPDAELVRAMAERRMFVVPTLTVYETTVGMPGGAVLLGDDRMAAFIAPAQRDVLRLIPNRPRTRPSYETIRQSLALLHQAGVRIVAGTDTPNPGTLHGASMHRELELLVGAGLSPIEALRAATTNGAAAFRLAGEGRIARGVRANLVLVDGDPTRDIMATRSIVTVWKDGVAFDRPAARATVAAQVDSAARAPRVAQAGAAAGTVLGAFDDGRLVGALGANPWMQTTDQMASGSSAATLMVVDGGAEGTARALQVTGTINGGLSYAWAGAMLMPGAQPMAPVDLSGAQGFRFMARGDGQTYRVMLFTRASGAAPLVRTFVAGAEWAEHTFAWRDFRGSEGKDVAGIAIVAGPAAGGFSLVVDEIRLR